VEPKRELLSVTDQQQTWKFRECLVFSASMACGVRMGLKTSQRVKGENYEPGECSQTYPGSLSETCLGQFAITLGIQIRHCGRTILNPIAKGVQKWDQACRLDV
jgi:hypothetical protein